ncbi:hypothetical protein TNCV_2711911 [Trichonephila clavipes]|nr:hypothetical protein TNCV_2711911 [Trichonephila clavipes]
MERGQKYAEKDHVEGQTMNSRERGKHLYCPKDHQIKDRRGGPIHLINRAVEKQEWRLPEPEGPGEVITEDTIQLRGDRSDLEGSQQCETLPVLYKEPLQRTRRTTGGAEEYGDRQPTTKQPQEKELQCGRIGRRSGR